MFTYIWEQIFDWFEVKKHNLCEGVVGREGVNKKETGSNDVRGSDFNEFGVL